MQWAQRFRFQTFFTNSIFQANKLRLSVEKTSTCRNLALMFLNKTIGAKTHTCEFCHIFVQIGGEMHFFWREISDFLKFKWVLDKIYLQHELLIGGASQIRNLIYPLQTSFLYWHLCEISLQLHYQPRLKTSICSVDLNKSK